MTPSENALPTALIDRARSAQFALLGHLRGGFRKFESWVDDGGIAWAGRRVGGHWLAWTCFGAGWAFDDFARRAWPDKWAAAARAMAAAPEARHRAELGEIARRIPTGPRAERILLAAHRRVLAAGASAVQVPDRWLASLVYGTQPGQPRHWRGDLLRRLRGLAWLHVAEAEPGDARPALGTGTALFTHVADLRGATGGRDCDEDCPMRGGAAHGHFHVSVGRGFLGVLERLAGPEDGGGVREYSFVAGGRAGGGRTLRDIRETGRLVTTFLPARLGEPDAVARLTPAQHRLLQATFREVTYAPGRRPRRGPRRVVAVEGGGVCGFNGRGSVACPGLDASRTYAGFNGNGVRRGHGYLLTSAGGWLAKTGYPRGRVGDFLDDCRALGDRLGLFAVGVGRGSQAFGPDELRRLALTAAGRRTLDALHVRLYAPADYLERWGAIFGWPAAGSAAPAASGEEVALAAAMQQAGVSKRRLAAALGVDQSFLVKILRGKKPWPPGLLARSLDAVRTAAAPPPAPGRGDGEASFFAAAAECLRRGWSIVPQRVGAKRPYVHWKHFQEERPTEAQLRAWADQWPDAGVAVVLGPVSGLFAVDVDGPEAHAELLSRLGAEPLAPKALSGSGGPCRYHLYFRHPDVATKAKATPWHPKLEFRGHRGLIVLPPSLHPSGRRYRWADGRSPGDLPLPDVPAAALEALTANVARPTLNAPTPVYDAGVQASPTTRQFLAGAYADGTGWNDAVFRAACDLNARGVPVEVAEPPMLRGARPRTRADIDAARATILSAYSRPRKPARL